MQVPTASTITTKYKMIQYYSNFKAILQQKRILEICQREYKEFVRKLK